MSVIGYLISMVIGNVVSLATMGNKNTEIDVDLVHHKVCYYMEKLLPKSWRQLQDKKPRQKITNAADRQLVANNNNVDIGPDIVDIKKDLTGAYFVGEGLSEDKRASVRLKKYTTVRHDKQSLSELVIQLRSGVTETSNKMTSKDITPIIKNSVKYKDIF